MATYLDNDTINDMTSLMERLIPIRTEGMEKHGIDITENDTLSNMTILKVVKSYDSSFDLNFGRNGEDAKADGIDDFELKSNTSVPRKRCGTYPSASWAFHAMGKLKHDAYMFILRNKKTSSPKKLWDIRNKTSIAIIENELLRLSDEWYEVTKMKKTSYDVIRLTEIFIFNNIEFTREIINGVEVFKDYE